MKQLKTQLFDRCKKSKSETFLQGEHKLNEELNILNLIQVVAKMKCALSVIVGNDRAMIHKI